MPALSILPVRMSSLVESPIFVYGKLFVIQITAVSHMKQAYESESNLLTRSREVQSAQNVVHDVCSPLVQERTVG